MEFTFTGTQSNVERICRIRDFSAEDGEEERRALARESMQVVFEHLSSRAVMALQQLRSQGVQINTLVISGGVASNSFLRHVLQAFLDARGFTNVNVISPPSIFCTDNAAMIAWTGVEMYGDGWESDLSIHPLRKWAVDCNAADGGVLGVGGWRRRRSRKAQ